MKERKELKFICKESCSGEFYEKPSPIISPIGSKDTGLINIGFEIIVPTSSHYLPTGNLQDSAVILSQIRGRVLGTSRRTTPSLGSLL